MLSVLSSWRQEPEWPLLWTASICIISFGVHATCYALARSELGVFQPTSWEGRTGWRKPILFGLSNAVLFVALRQGIRSQQLVPRAVTSHVASWLTLIEVSVITLQAHRGEPSHFNTSTPLNAALYAVKLTGASVLGVACLGVALGCWLRPSGKVHKATRAALQWGFALLSVAVIVGFAQVAYGHSLASFNAASDLRSEHECRLVTAGMHGAACYECRGRARLKILHFVPLHSTEALLALSWAAQRLGLPERESTSVVRRAAAAIGLLTAASGWQVLTGGPLSLQGLARLELEPPAAVLALAGLSMATSALTRLYFR